MPRADGRRVGELRPITIQRHFSSRAPGSVLIQWGGTHVLCTACISEGVPGWRAGGGLGWLTAEYDMLPGATQTRRPRNRQRIDGRTQEIQRLIGRALRAVVAFANLGEHTLQIDCDVIRADGGTRTAAITGAYVAARDAIRSARRAKLISRDPFVGAVAAVSVGRVNGRVLLDLDYSEDVQAEVDMNVAMTDAGEFIEVQGTGEESTFTRQDLDRMLRAAGRGIGELLRLQQRALRRPGGRTNG